MMDLPIDIWARIWGCLDDMAALPLDGTMLVLLTAVGSGDLELLDHIRMNIRNFMDWDELIMEEAAETGQIGVLRWMLPFGPRETTTQLVLAAQFGHLVVLRYFHERGYFMDEEVIDGASRGGHWDCVLWALENGYPLSDEVRETGQLEEYPEEVPAAVTRALRRRLASDAAMARIRLEDHRIPIHQEVDHDDSDTESD